MDRPQVRWGLTILVILWTIATRPVEFVRAMWLAYIETREQLRKEKHAKAIPRERGED